MRFGTKKTPKNKKHLGSIITRPSDFHISFGCLYSHLKPSIFN